CQGSKRMKRFIANSFLLWLIAFLFTTHESHSQITWEKLFTQSNTDVFRSVIEVPSGGYIAAGYTSQWSANDTDAFVVRMDVNGDTIWTQTFDGGEKDLFYKVINTFDGGFMLCGYSSSFGNGSDDAYYVKLDSNGNELWHFTYGGIGKDRAQDVAATMDGGYILAGYTNSGTGSQGVNSFLVKLDSNGGQTWSKRFGGLSYDDANSVKQLSDGGYILTGQTWSSGAGAGDVWVVRTNASGDT